MVRPCVLADSAQVLVGFMWGHRLHWLRPVAHTQPLAFAVVDVVAGYIRVHPRGRRVSLGSLGYAVGSLGSPLNKRGRFVHCSAP